MTNSTQIFQDPNDFDGWSDIQKEDMATILNLMKREITIKEEPIDILSAHKDPEFEQKLINQCSTVEKLRIEPGFDETSMNQTSIPEKLRIEPEFDVTTMNQSSIGEELRTGLGFKEISINHSSITEKLRMYPRFDETSMNHSLIVDNLSMTTLIGVEDVSTQGGFTLNEVEGNFFLTENSKHVSYCINRIFALNRQRRSNTDKLKDTVFITGEIEALKDKERHIYNLKAQDNCTADIAYKSMKSSLEAMKTHATAHGVTHIHLPLICFGLNGLGWPCVRSLIKNVFGEGKTHFTVYHVGKDTLDRNLVENKGVTEMVHTAFNNDDQNKEEKAKEEYENNVLKENTNVSHRINGMENQERNYISDKIESLTVNTPKKSIDYEKEDLKDTNDEILSKEISNIESSTKFNDIKKQSENETPADLL